MASSKTNISNNKTISNKTIGNKYISLPVIYNYDFDLLRKRCQKEFESERIDSLKKYAKEQLAWIDDALCYRELVNTICQKLFPSELDKILKEKCQSKYNRALFLQGISLEDEEINKQNINRLVNSVYNAIALDEKNCIVDVMTKYKFVKDLVLKLYCLYERSYNDKYVIDEEME